MLNQAYRIPSLLIAGCLLLTLVQPARGEPDEPRPVTVILAADGKARLPIVISDKASPSTRETARELADYLFRITGAKFEVQTGDGKNGIVLGTIAEFPTPDLAKPLAVRDTYQGREAYAVRTQRNRVLLLGATDLAVPHAAFRLLEHVGCRWFFPAKEWEVVPSKPTLEVELNETDRPALLSRRIWYGYGFFDRDKRRAADEYQAWARHNRMGASLKPHCGHAWQSIIADNKKQFDEHPEYLALVKDKRQGPQLCVSNPEVRKLAVGWALGQLEKDPARDMVSLETSDGLAHCECEACRKLGSVSDRAFGLANEAARAVAKEHPGKMIGMLAYSDHCEPPSFPLEPNVYVQSTAGFIHGRYTFEELMKLWPEHCKNIGFYEYFSVWLWDFDMPTRARGADIRYHQRRIAEYVRLGATSLDCESGNNWGPNGLGYWIANRLMWNPKADVDALRTDFFEKAFGPAAPVMRRYYERLDPASHPLLSEHLLALALRDLEEAAKQAKDRPDVLARLDHLKQYQHYVRLRWEHDHATDKERKREWALAALTHSYRTRWSYMNHWAAMLYGWTGRAAEEFDRPEWAHNARGANQPWKVEKPVSQEETERLFREDLERFRPARFEEKTFSDDLVPGTFTSAKPALSNQRWQRGTRYALYSRDGEPLEATITTGIIAWYRDRPEARYTVTDARGTVVEEKRLPQDGKEHALSVKVPRAGLYWLDFDDSGAAWGIKAAPGQPVSLVLRRDRQPIHLGQMQRMYFHVPRGTKELAYFWSGQPHQVLGPDGKVLLEAEGKGKVMVVPVPAGADGQVWSFAKMASGQLWFFNVPNVLAASPEALLVPREIADKKQP